MKHEKITVAESVQKRIGTDVYIGNAISWCQLNRISEDLWQNSDKLEYIGAYKDKHGTMCSVFQEMLHNKNNSYRRGKVYFVDNDVVFEFQEDGKRIARRKFDGGTQG